MYLPTKDTLLKGSANNLFDDVYAIFFLIFFINLYCGYPFELHRQADAIQMDTHNICLYTDVVKNYSDSNLNTTELLDCALIGLCAVIRENTVFLR